MATKLVMSVVASIFSQSPWATWWHGTSPAQKAAGLIAFAVFLVIFIAAWTGLLILIRSTAPKFVDRCRKSIAGSTLRNFLVGASVIALWFALASFCDTNEECSAGNLLGTTLFYLAIFLWTIKMFGGAAMCQLLGEKALSLRGNKKQGDIVINIAVGLSVIVLATTTFIPGLIAFSILASIELGAVICVSLRMS